MDMTGYMTAGIDGFIRLSLISQIHNPLSRNCIIDTDDRLPFRPVRMAEVARTNSLSNAQEDNFPDEEAETQQAWIRVTNLTWLNKLRIPLLEPIYVQQP